MEPAVEDAVDTVTEAATQAVAEVAKEVAAETAAEIVEEAAAEEGYGAEEETQADEVPSEVVQVNEQEEAPEVAAGES